MGAGLSSWLHIAHASLTDNGNYTCSAGDAVHAFVRVHVLDGESSAAMHHSNTGGATSTLTTTTTTPPITLLFILIHLTLH
ncbi:hypothetical protein Pmani_038574 [Petrolisthes manimaculis]|uniref:Uncharacterized protein n=1 Tax=Petrolisthes manimaculis TaxID=1843537 RepID=A0AAE1TM56_9EUCA|nr:hypothetical protein Pmani_038574 [Petrolisthes manimaculis]